MIGKKKNQEDKCSCNILNTKISELEEKCAELQAGWVRTQADYVNYKKRSEEMVSGISKMVRAEVVADFLPICDATERAMEVVTDEKSKEGINKMYQMFFDILSKYDIKAVSVEGDYDPMTMEVVGYVDDTAKAGKVAQKVESGFVMGDRIVRSAKVIVYK